MPTTNPENAVYRIGIAITTDLARLRESVEHLALAAEISAERLAEVARGRPIKITLTAEPAEGS